MGVRERIQSLITQKKIIFLLLVLFILTILFSGGNKTDTAKVYDVGEPATLGERIYTVTDVKTATSVGFTGWSVQARGKYIIIYLTIENTGTEPFTVNVLSSNAVLYDETGRKFGADGPACDHLTNEFTIQAVQPGLANSGQIAYDVPDGTYFLRVSEGGVDSKHVDIYLGNVSTTKLPEATTTTTLEKTPIVVGKWTGGGKYSGSTPTEKIQKLFIYPLINGLYHGILLEMK